MKKSTSKKPSTSRRGTATFEFVKATKDIPAGIATAVYEAIKKAKRGTVADITALAVKKFKLATFTDQDPMNQTHVHLNRLCALKAVKRVMTPKVRSSRNRKSSASVAAPESSPSPLA